MSPVVLALLGGCCPDAEQCHTVADWKRLYCEKFPDPAGGAACPSLAAVKSACGEEYFEGPRVRGEECCYEEHMACL